MPLVLSWLHDGGSAHDAIGRVQAPLYDTVAAPGLLSVGLVVLFLAAFTWFRAGYIRSIVGRFHARPQNGAQFASLLGLYALIEVAGGLGAWIIATTDAPVAATLAGIVVLLFTVAVMYADYAIVITGLDPVRAIARSWACLRANLALSILVVLVVDLVATAARTALARTATGGLAQAVPVLVIFIVVMGVVTFAADVVLVVAYVNATETGRLPRAR